MNAAGGWELYDYVDKRGMNQIKQWCLGLEKRDLARINAKLNMLEHHGPDLPPQLLAGPLKGQRHIYKLKVKGQVQLRLLLCRGPIKNDLEFTLLLGAFEKDWKYDPPNAPDTAEARRQEVIGDPQRRRRPHEEVS